MIPLSAKIIGAVALVALTWFALNQQYKRGYTAGRQAEYQLRQTALEQARQAGEEATARAVAWARELSKELIRERAITQTITNTIVERVPVYVTEEIDRTYPLSVGWVRVHDTAASGGSVAPVSIYPGRANDATADVRASQSAATIARNYGVCVYNEQYVRALQQYIVGLEDWYESLRENWGAQ